MSKVNVLAAVLALGVATAVGIQAQRNGRGSAKPVTLIRNSAASVQPRLVTRNS